MRRFLLRLALTIPLALTMLAGCSTAYRGTHDYASSPPIISTDPRWDTPASRSMGIVLDPQPVP
jgi:hypothetical protein